MNKLICISLLLLASHLHLNAATLRGKAKEINTGKELPGATIYLVELKKGVQADGSGSFFIKNIPNGEYTVQCSYISFQTIEKKITFRNNEDAVVDFKLISKDTELGEVVVTTNANRGTDVSARLTEKLANQVINVISSKTIESLPDLNVANVMQRVSGVSMVKNFAGNNTEAIIRGMPPRYNSALVNGTTAPSTSGSTRSVPLDIIPSNLVGRIEVTKALTPDQEANGLGGSVNVEMKDAPETPLLSIDMASGYNQFFFDNKMSTFNSGVVNRKDPAERFGNDYLTNLTDFTRGNMIITQKKASPDLNGSFSFGHRFLKNKFGILVSGTATNTNQGIINNYSGYDYTTSNTYILTGKSTSNYYTQALRMGSNVKMDYRFNDKNRISLHSSLFRLTEDRVRHQADTTSEINWGRVGSTDITNIDISSLTSANLQGHHELLKNLEIDWSLIYSVATSQSPDLVTVNYVQIIHPVIQPFYLNYKSCVTRGWQHNLDEDKTAFLNVKYKPILFNHLVEIKIGGMARKKFRNNYANDYTFDAPLNNPPNPDIRTVIVTQNSNDQQRNGNPVNNPGNYKATEDIQAGYVQIKTNFGKLQVLTGVRTEFTYQTNYHSETQNVLVPFTQNRFFYFDVLPSLHLNYVFDEKRNLRLSYYQGISRPNYTELVDFHAQSVYGGSNGNAHLNHSTGTCIDARYEVYPNKEEVFTGGIFFKKIEKPIVDLLSNNNVTSPMNLSDPCTNYGFELVGLKYFGNFGLSGNYTFTSSARKYPGKISYPTPDAVTKQTETIPLVGQSPHIINAALIYRDIEKGFKCQVVYTMQGKNLKQISSYYAQDVYQLAFHDLGATIEKKISKNFLLYAKINNLLNSKVEYESKGGIHIRDVSTSMSFLAGIKYNL